MRWVIACLTLLLLALQYALWVAPDGLREVWRLDAAVSAQQAENESFAQRNSALAAEVADLKEGLAALEERARSELGMTRRDEAFYQIADPASADAGADEPD